MKDRVQRKLPFDTAESQTPSMHGNSMRENREASEAPSLTPRDGWGTPCGSPTCTLPRSRMVPYYLRSERTTLELQSRSPRREGDHPRGTLYLTTTERTLSREIGGICQYAYDR